MHTLMYDDVYIYIYMISMAFSLVLFILRSKEKLVHIFFQWKTVKIEDKLLHCAAPPA